MSPTAKQKPVEQIILGIDPGTTIMGYGVICVRGKSVELVEMGALHLSKYKDHAVKLKRIYDRCSALIQTHAPITWRWKRLFSGRTSNPCSSWGALKA